MNLTLRNECLCISWLFSDIKITSCSVAQPQCPTKVSLVKVVFGGGHGIQTSWKKKVLSLDQFWIISHHVLHWTDVFTHPSLGFLCGVLFTNWHTHSVQSDVLCKQFTDWDNVQSGKRWSSSSVLAGACIRISLSSAGGSTCIMNNGWAWSRCIPPQLKNRIPSRKTQCCNVDLNIQEKSYYQVHDWPQ